MNTGPSSAARAPETADRSFRTGEPLEGPFAGGLRSCSSDVHRNDFLSCFFPHFNKPRSAQRRPPPQHRTSNNIASHRRPRIAAELFHHRRNLRSIRNRNRLQLHVPAPPAAIRMVSFFTTLLYHCVSDPHRQQINLFAVDYEPHRLRDSAPGLATGHAQVDFTIASESLLF